MNDKDLIISLLAIQYIKDQNYDSATELVSLFRQAEEEIRAAYESSDGFSDKPSDKPFSLNGLIT